MAWPRVLALDWPLRTPRDRCPLGVILSGLPSLSSDSRDLPGPSPIRGWTPGRGRARAALAVVIAGSHLRVREVVSLGMGSGSGGDPCRAGLPGGRLRTQATRVR